MSVRGLVQLTAPEVGAAASAFFVAGAALRAGWLVGWRVRQVDSVLRELLQTVMQQMMRSLKKQRRERAKWRRDTVRTRRAARLYRLAASRRTRCTSRSLPRPTPSAPWRPPPPPRPPPPAARRRSGRRSSAWSRAPSQARSLHPRWYVHAPACGQAPEHGQRISSQVGSVFPLLHHPVDSTPISYHYPVHRLGACARLHSDTDRPALTVILRPRAQWRTWCCCVALVRTARGTSPSGRSRRRSRCHRRRRHGPAALTARARSAAPAISSRPSECMWSRRWPPTSAGWWLLTPTFGWGGLEHAVSRVSD